VQWINYSKIWQNSAGRNKESVQRNLNVNFSLAGLKPLSLSKNGGGNVQKGLLWSANNAPDHDARRRSVNQQIAERRLNLPFRVGMT
jgi:hypothetical protein